MHLAICIALNDSLISHVLWSVELEGACAARRVSRCGLRRALICVLPARAWALAQLALLDIPRRAHLITFGSTKAVSRSLANAIVSKADKALRFVFGCDVAPLFPFTELHHSHPALQIGPPRAWWRLLLGPWDHRMANYLRELEG